MFKRTGKDKQCWPIITETQGLLFSDCHKVVNRHWYHKYGKNIQDVSVLRTSHFLKGPTDQNHLSTLAMTSSLWIWASSLLNCLRTHLAKTSSSQMWLAHQSKPATQEFMGENSKSHCFTCATSSKSSWRFCKALARWRDFPTPVCLLRNASPWFSIQSSTYSENKYMCH